jgi:hypothetical protein
MKRSHPDLDLRRGRDLTSLFTRSIMMNFQGKFSFQENSRLIAQCPICNAPVEKLDIRLIRETEGRQMVHIHCCDCLGSMVALLFHSGPGLASVGLVTDLSFGDLLKFTEEKEIGPDDVLEAHELLRTERFLGKL